MVRSGGPAAARGVATLSTGNFGLGVAYAARGHGIDAAIVLPQGANPRKVAMIRRLGARIVEIPAGETGEAVLDAVAADAGYAVLRDGHDDRIANGAGTLALEVTDAVADGRLPPIGTVYAPIGDGSLIAGVGTWLRSVSPSARVVGVQVEGAPAMARSWRSGRVEVVPPALSRADGLTSGSGNPDLLDLLRRVVDDMVLVREEQLLDAQLELFDALGVTAEASAAAAWLAARDSRDDGAATGVRLVIVTGSNAWPGELAGPTHRDPAEPWRS